MAFLAVDFLIDLGAVFSFAAALTLVAGVFFLASVAGFGCIVLRVGDARAGVFFGVAPSLINLNEEFAVNATFLATPVFLNKQTKENKIKKTIYALAPAYEIKLSYRCDLDLSIFVHLF